MSRIFIVIDLKCLYLVPFLCNDFLVENMRPAIESKLQQQLTEKITGEVQQKHAGVAGKLLLTEISGSGDKAIATMTLPNGNRLPLDMRKENGRWQIVGGDHVTLEATIGNRGKSSEAAFCRHAQLENFAVKEFQK